MMNSLNSSIEDLLAKISKVTNDYDEPQPVEEISNLAFTKSHSYKSNKKIETEQTNDKFSLTTDSNSYISAQEVK